MLDNFQNCPFVGLKMALRFPHSSCKCHKHFNTTNALRRHSYRMVCPRHGHLSKIVILSVHLFLWDDDDEGFPLTSIEDTWACNVLFRKVTSTIDRYFLVIIHSTVSVSRVIALAESHFIEVFFIDNSHILARYCQINITINEQILPDVHMSENLQSLKVISADKL